MKAVKMPFGKHAGKALTNIPREYLEWAYDNMEALDDAKMQAIRALLDKYKSMERQKK